MKKMENLGWNTKYSFDKSIYRIFGIFNNK